LLWTRLNLLFLFNSIYIFLMSHYQIIWCSILFRLLKTPLLVQWVFNFYAQDLQIYNMINYECLFYIDMN
jgi:hypothetical protein